MAANPKTSLPRKCRHCSPERRSHMDVHCSSCNEPWDAYHLRHDAIFETDLDPAEAHAWRSLRSSEQLSRRYRQKFKAAGYEFGGSILNVRRCPCCPKGIKPDPEKD